LRKALNSESAARFLHADDLTIKFEGSSDFWLDTAELERLSAHSASDELIAVLSNYQGELLPGFYDEWVVLEREHLFSIFEQNIARLMSSLQAEKRWGDILEWGERWIKLGQKPEPAYRALMSAHAAKGDMSKVAATYERCVKSLKELSVEPSNLTKELYERLKAGKETFETGPTISAQEKRKESPKTNLPIPLTSFIGREKEIEEIIRLLGKHRLLTLTGPGGVGKTRLAIQPSGGMLGKFKDGVWWVELAPLMDEALVPQAVAQVLGVRESPGQLLIESLKSFLREKQLLLVLDNCEHLIGASAQFAFDLLSHCANLRILTTSREALGVTGEIVYSVPTLSFPKLKSVTLTDLLLEYESIRLFVERACAVNKDFVLTEQNAAAVLQICQRLDGISLALELAAARTTLLSVEEIADRLNDRFNLLTQGSRTALPRHQTLRAAIDWSYDLLSEQEQVLFRRLSVFVGGWTLGAAQVVCLGDGIEAEQVLDLLTDLVDKSLVMRREQDQETRYQMLETIGEYAREKLDETRVVERLRQRHCDYFIVLAEQAEPKLKGGEQFEWLDRLELEHDNLRSAWEWAIESDIKLAVRLASALLNFWRMRGNPGEGREWATKLLERTAQWSNVALRARALGVAGLLAHLQSDFASARPLLTESLAIARRLADQKQIAFALLWLSDTALPLRDEHGAQQYSEECLTLYQVLQDPWGIALGIRQSAKVASVQGNYAEAEQGFMTSLAKLRELGDKFCAAQVLNMLGELARFLGNYERAADFYEQSLDINRELDSHLSLAIPLFNLAWVSLRYNDYSQAKGLLEETLKLFREFGDESRILYCVGGFAALMGINGKPAHATRLFGAVESLLETIGMDWSTDRTDQKEFDRYLTIVRDQLDEAAFARAWKEGQAMTLEQAIEFALKGTNQ
jgi:non-specific serine/threonine protein kinase